MTYFMYLMMISIILTSIMILINIFLSMNMNINREKNTPFECGFNPHSNSRLPFTTHFFLITLLFLIFDIEIMILLPSLFMMNSFNNLALTTVFLSFMFILIISLIYEWMYGMLEWIMY